jgi:hypothetical protein
VRTLTTLVVAILLSPVALAQDKGELSTQTYDVRLLITPLPDYPLRPMLHGTADNLRQAEAEFARGGGLFGGLKIVEIARPPKDDPGPIHEIIDLITATVAPETWRSAGGTTGSISSIKSFLIVTQTAENHRAIKTLLAQLNDRMHRPVRVQAHWLLLTPEQLATIKPAAGQESLATVPEETVKNAKVYSRGQITGFDGQPHAIAATVERNYLTDLSPVVGTGVWAFDPTIDRISSGVALQFRTQLGEDGLVRLDLVNEVQELPDHPSREINVTQLFNLTSATTRPLEGPTSLDRPRIAYQTAQTSLRIPLGTHVLVSGTTLEPGTRENPRELYLVIRVDADKKP